ncbi:hypothetical protein D3C73_1244090 [compost metagenome]
MVHGRGKGLEISFYFVNPDIFPILCKLVQQSAHTIRVTAGIDTALNLLIQRGDPRFLILQSYFELRKIFGTAFCSSQSRLQVFIFPFILPQDIMIPPDNNLIIVI